jgi:hypothetical protein
VHTLHAEFIKARAPLDSHSAAVCHFYSITTNSKVIIILFC